jgi:hypothetical protein
MNRAVVSLLLAPLLTSLLEGVLGAVVVFPFMVMAAFATFFLFRALGWLRWWQAALGGLIAGAVVPQILIGSLTHIDAFGAQEGIKLGGLGTLTAILFWWMGVFRNSAFPSVPRTWPYGMIVLVPLTAAGFMVLPFLQPTFAQGRIVTVSGDPPRRQVTVRLPSGNLVQSTFDRDSRPTSVLMNQCWHLMNYWSLFEFKRVYSLSSPFGGDGDSC